MHLHNGKWVWQPKTFHAHLNPPISKFLNPPLRTYENAHKPPVSPFEQETVTNF